MLLRQQTLRLFHAQNDADFSLFRRGNEATVWYAVKYAWVILQVWEKSILCMQTANLLDFGRQLSKKKVLHHLFSRFKHSSKGFVLGGLCCSIMIMMTSLVSDRFRPCLMTMKPWPTIQLIVDYIFQPLQPLEDGLPVHQVGNFAIPCSQPLVRNAPNLDELLGSVLDPAVDREQDNPHKHQNVDGQQSFDFACHSHERRILSGWLSQAQQLSVCGGLLCHLPVPSRRVILCSGREGQLVKDPGGADGSVQHHGQLRTLRSLLRGASHPSHGASRWEKGCWRPVCERRFYELYEPRNRCTRSVVVGATYYTRQMTPGKAFIPPSSPRQLQNISPPQREKSPVP